MDNLKHIGVIMDGTAFIRNTRSVRDKLFPYAWILITGNGSGDPRQMPYISFNELMVMGTWNSSFPHEKDDDWHYVMELQWIRNGDFLWIEIGGFRKRTADDEG